MAAGERPEIRLDPEAGMVPLFSMTKGFIDAVQQRTIGAFIDGYSINSFSDLETVPWQDYVTFGIGFVVCAAIGVLLAFVLPISGCSIGCARCCKCCCKCCGGRKKYLEVSGHSRKKEYGCAGGLLGVTCILLAAVVCSFVATEMYRRELDPKTGALEDVLRGVQAVDDYINETLVELNDTAVIGIQTAVHGVYDVIDRMPNETRDRLGDETQVRPALYGLADFANNMTLLQTALADMDTNRQVLDTQMTDLENSLNTSRTDLQPLLTSCINDSVVGVHCQSVLDILPNLTVCSDFSGLSDTTNAQLAVQAAIASGVSDHINTGVQAYENISYVIEDAINQEMGDIKSTLGDVEREVIKAMVDLTQQLSVIDLTSAEDAIITAKPYLEEYGHYAYAGIVSLNTVMLLIVVLLFLGIIVGLLCPPATDRSKACDATSKHGARLLLAASGITFVFSWVIVIFVVVFFIGGGAVQSLACRHLITYDSSMDRIEGILWNTIGNIGYNITLKGVMEECKANSSFYKAVDAEANGVNISSILDLDKYGVYDLIRQLNNTNITIGQVDIMDPAINASLAVLDEQLSAIDYDGYDKELANNVTCTPLDDLAVKLRQIATNLSATDPVLSQQLEDQALILESFQVNVTSQINTSKADLQSDVDTATSIYSQPLVDLVNDLDEAETVLNSRADVIIKEQISIYGTEILGYITDFTGTVEYVLRNDLGSCRSLYDAGVDLVYGPCVYLLDPVNAIWFCYGWYLIFCIPALILAIQLADIFKVMVPKEQPIEHIELPPTGDAQHYALYYKSKGTTEHYGIPNTKVYSGTAMQNGYRGSAKNKVYPMTTDNYQQPHDAIPYQPRPAASYKSQKKPASVTPSKRTVPPSQGLPDPETVDPYRPKPAADSGGYQYKGYSPKRKPKHRDFTEEDYFRT